MCPDTKNMQSSYLTVTNKKSAVFAELNQKQTLSRKKFITNISPIMTAKQ